LLNLTGNFIEGLSLVNRLLQEDPKNSSFLDMKGKILGNLGRFQEALKLFNESLEICDSMETHENKIRSLILLEKYDQAIKTIDDLKNTGKDAEWLAVKAVLLDKLGQKRETQECIDKALKMDNKDSNVLQGVSAIYIKNNQIKKAQPLVDRLLRQNPENLAGLCMKGLILAFQGQNKKGLKIIESAIKKEPKYGWSWFLRGWVLLMNNKEKEALSNFMLAVNLDPNVITWIDEYSQFSQFRKTADWKEFQNLIKGGLNRNVN